MTPRWLLFSVLFLVQGVAALQAADSPLEFRAIVPEGTPGAIKKTVDGQTLHCGSEVLLDVQMVRKATLLPAGREPDGAPKIELHFTEEGKQRLAKHTSSHRMERFGILSFGKLLIAPTIVHPINGGLVLISGSFTEEEARAIVEAINKSLKP